jgi:hypothetical protein
VRATAYTAMKPDAPVTSTFDPGLIAGIVIDVDRSGWMEGGGIVVLEWCSGGGWRCSMPGPYRLITVNVVMMDTSICGLLYMIMGYSYIILIYTII